MNNTCDNFNQAGCDPNGGNVPLQNFVSSLCIIILGIFILMSNSIILFCYLKFRNDTWNFISFCITELIVYNILASLACFLLSTSYCINFLDNMVLCVIKYCLNYFIILMTLKVNFCMAIARLYKIKRNKSLVMDALSLKIVKFIIPIIILFLTFTPLTFEWNNYEQNCDCAANFVLPSVYVMISNGVMLLLGVLTIVCYGLIYKVVRDKCVISNDSNMNDNSIIVSIKNLIPYPFPYHLIRLTFTIKIQLYQKTYCKIWRVLQK